MRGTSTLSGWWVFAGVLLLIAGTLNVIFGVAAISNSAFLSGTTVYILRDLRLWGWLSLIVVASINAVGVLLTISTYPISSLAIFALSIIIIYKLAEGPRIVAS